MLAATPIIAPVVADSDPTEQKSGRPERTKPTCQLGELIYDEIVRRGWSYPEAVQRLNKGLLQEGDRNETIDRTTLTRWLTGTRPHQRNRRRISVTFGIPLDKIDKAIAAFEDERERQGPSAIPGVPENGRMSDVERRDFLKIAAGVGYLGLSPDQLARLVTGIAHEARVHLARAELSNIGPLALEQLSSEVVRLSRAFVSQPRIGVFAELVQLRDSIYALLKGNQSPRQATDLYLLAGQTCGLLADASVGLGNHVAASAQAHSAWAYGQFIGHSDLSAFGRATQSLAAYWSGDYQDAVAFARSGQEFADSPDVQARLITLEARALAKLGSTHDVPVLISRAEEVIERADSSVRQGTGGQLVFTTAKLNYYATKALADLGRHDDAIAHGERSVRLYQTIPDHLRDYRDEAHTYVTLAETSMRQLSVDGAAARLAPLFTHPQKRLIGDDQPLNRMLDGLSVQLRDVRLRGADARALAERIDGFQTGVAAIPG